MASSKKELTVVEFNFDNWDFVRKDYTDAFIVALLLLVFSLAYAYTEQIGLFILIPFLALSSFYRQSNMKYVALFLILLSTNFFEFADLQNMAYMQIAPGVRFNTLDIVVFTMVPLGFLQRQDRAGLTTSLVMYIIVVAFIYVALNLFITFNPSEAGFNYFRKIFYTTVYFIYLRYFSDADSIKQFLLVVAFWAIFGTVIQAYEFFLDHRVTLPGITPFSDYYSEEGQKIVNAGVLRLYVWSRVTMLIFIAAAFSLPLYLTLKKRFFLLAFVISIAGFAIASSRIWFVGIMAIVFVVLVFTDIKKYHNVVIMAALLLLVAFGVREYYYVTTNRDVFELVFGRFISIFSLGQTYGEQDTFSTRLFFFYQMWYKWLQEPLFGFGFGASVVAAYYNVDLGVINRLVLMGLVGTLPILLFNVAYMGILAIGIRDAKNLNKKVLMKGVLAFVTAQLILYIWQIDFWGNYYVIPLMAVFAMSDRILRGKVIK